jgi:hypothetical protein
MFAIIDKLHVTMGAVGSNCSTSTCQHTFHGLVSAQYNNGLHTVKGIESTDRPVNKSMEFNFLASTTRIQPRFKVKDMLWSRLYKLLGTYRHTFH